MERRCASRCSAGALTLAGLLALPACGDDAVPPSIGELPADLCLTPLAPDEPLCNRYLAQSPWAASHRSPHAQGSSPEAAPAADATLSVDHITLPGIPVILTFDAADEDGGRTIWATLIGFDNAIAKIDHESLDVLDVYVPGERESDPPTIPLGVTGAYTVIDSAGHFVVARARFVSFYGDATEGERTSKIGLLGRTILPDAWFCTSDDVIAAMGLTYDGRLALATEQGNVIVTRGDADGFETTETSVVSLNGAACDDPNAELEIVSNNLAVDETGGIYVVSSAAMYRFDVTDGALATTWRAAYETEGSVSPIRLGPGSGSTPSLMGTARDEDGMVVITDGQQLMHLVFMWRDEIPADWQAIAPGKDRRIACEVPIDFGDASATASSSEQSVMVRGNAAVVVNNLVKDPTITNSLPAVQNLVTALESGQEAKAPFGVQRVTWDPTTRTCETTWANPDITIPNGIPTMSAATGLVYGIGKRDGAWGLEALDMDSGAAPAFTPSPTSCADADLSPLGILLNVQEVTDAIAADPHFCENSLYAATTVGPDGMIYTGTFGGLTRYVPDVATALDAAAQADAGVAQALDLLDRALGGAPGPVDRLELTQRTARQLLAVFALDAEPAVDVRAALDQVAVALHAADDDDAMTQALEDARAVLDPGD